MVAQERAVSAETVLDHRDRRGVEVEDADTGEGLTFFLAPVGAGMTLTGPGGDGHLSVATPASPIGRAVLGKHEGDVVDVTVEGDVREWMITYVG